MSFFFSGKKDSPTTPPEKAVPTKSTSQQGTRPVVENSVPPTPIVSHTPAVQSLPSMTMQTQPQVSAADSPQRSRVASNPPVVVPVEIQSQPPAQSNVSTTSTDMFLGMSTAAASVPPSVSNPPKELPTRAQVATTPQASPQAATNVPPQTSSASPGANVVPKKAAISSPKTQKLNNADVCEQIKTLSAEVVCGFQKQVSEQASLQLQLVEKGRALRLSLDQEQINGRRLQKLVEETEKEQIRLAEAEEFELADALSMKVILRIGSESDLSVVRKLSRRCENICREFNSNSKRNYQQ